LTDQKEIKVPRYNTILNLPGFSIKKVSGFQPILFDVEYHRKPRCPHCNSLKVRKKDSSMREVKHEMFGHRMSLLRFKAYKLYCNGCKRYGNQQFPGIGKNQRATHRLQTQIFHQHTRGISQKDLSQSFKLGKATIERWYHHHYRLQENEMMNAPCPTVLGIDEHFFSKKQGFATTLCDLKKHKVFDIVKGRSEAELADYLENLQGKERVRIVCMDLSSNYRSIVKRNFPNAMIVADRFHVVRLMQHQCMKSFRQLSGDIKHNRGILAALRTKPERLTDKRKFLRDSFFKENPAIESLYLFQQRMHDLLLRKRMTKKQCRSLVKEFLEIIHMMKESPFIALQSLARTFYHWREEIGRMWRFTKSNGITEGFHRKMKLIQRRAYGFRNFENYRTRVRVLCK
jgi:transposase